MDYGRIKGLGRHRIIGIGRMVSYSFTISAPKGYLRYTNIVPEYSGSKSCGTYLKYIGIRRFNFMSMYGDGYLKRILQGYRWKLHCLCTVKYLAFLKSDGHELNY